jgi:hypothetical protein
MKVFLKGSFLFSALVLIIGLVFVIVSFSYSTTPRTVPLALGLFVVAMSILILLGEKYPKLMSKFGGILEDLGETKLAGSGQASPRSKKTGRKFLIICAWIISFYVMIFLFGYLIAIPIFVIAFLKTNRRSWLSTMIITVLVSGLAYGGFQLGMRADFFEGIVFGGIVPPI